MTRTVPPSTFFTLSSVARRCALATERNRQIMAAYLAGASQADLASRYGVSRTRISQIVSVLRATNLHFRRVA